MTVVENARQYFQPKNDVSRKDMVLAGLACRAPLEPGSVVTYQEIGEWLGEEFPRWTDFGRAYDPMDEVKDHLLKARGVLLLNVETMGYKAATDAEKVEHAERFGYLASLQRMRYGNVVLGSVDRSKVSHTQAELTAFMIREMTEEQRVMRAKLRDEHKRARRWVS